MPMSLGNPSTNCRPFQLGNARIPLSNPTLGGSFAQIGAQDGSIPMSGGAFIPQPYAQHGITTGIGPSFIPQSGSLFGNTSISRGKMFGSNLYYSSRQQTKFQPYFPRTNIPGINAYGGGSNPYKFQQNWNSVQPLKIPFLATLNLPNLSKLINDPIRNSSAWPPIPTKLPSDLPSMVFLELIDGWQC